MSLDTTPVQLIRGIGERRMGRERKAERREDVIYLYFEIRMTPLLNYFLERHNRALCDWVLLLCKC